MTQKPTDRDTTIEEIYRTRRRIAEVDHRQKSRTTPESRRDGPRQGAGERDETPRFDSGIWSEDPVPMLLADEDGVVGGEPAPEWHESLQTWLEGEDPFRKPFRP